MTLTKKYLKEAMDFAISKVDEKLEEFKTSFLSDQSRGYNYIKSPCVTWVDGFWPGMVMLAYEYTGDKKYYEAFKSLNAVMSHRIEHKIAVDHHDLGFLYSPCAVADYKVTGNERSKKMGIAAADVLISRYKPAGEFIQAWGALDDPDNYALIIDCLINLPILLWATEVTGNAKYREIAEKHMLTALHNVVREDNTTFHKYHFDPKTGAPAFGKTAQGYSDDSCWARGQSWGILGAALNYSYTKNAELAEYYTRLLDCFISRLPSDHIPYWDMIFTDGSGEPRDTSAAMITACGIMEMNKYLPNEEYIDIAEKMFVSATENYTSKKLGTSSNVLLTDGMVSRPAGHVPEALPYGDYYYMEYIMRNLNPDWKMYW